MPELSIIIVNWNSRPFLQDCLDSIFTALPGFQLEVIVADNGSSDGSGEMLRARFPAVRRIENQANLGFAAANNQGAKTAEGRYLLFLNPDTLILPGTLEGAVAFMEQHPEAGIMGCRTLNPDGSQQATVFAFPTPLRVFANVLGLNRIFKLSRFTDHSSLRTADFVQGSFLIIEKRVFDGLGGFDEGFFLYAEEVDLCLRLKAAGRRTYFFPGVSISHHGGGSGRGSPAALGHFARSHIRLYRKYRSPRQERQLRRALGAALCLRCVLEAVFSSRAYRTRKADLKRLRHELAEVPDRDHS